MTGGTVTSLKKRIGVCALAAGVVIAGLAAATAAQASRSSNAARSGAVAAARVPGGVAVPDAFTPISNPTAAYVSHTCKYDLSAIADLTPVSSLTQCGHTASFKPTTEKRSV